MIDRAEIGAGWTFRTYAPCNRNKLVHCPVKVDDRHRAIRLARLGRHRARHWRNGGNPVELGLVASLNNLGGNVTGVTFIVVDSARKRLGLLRKLAPSAIAIAMLINPNFPSTAVEAAAVQVGARSLGLRSVRLLYAGTSSEIDAAFATFVLERPDALLVGGDPFLLGQRDQIVLLAERYAVSTIYPQREYADAGGLMSYGSNIPEAIDRLASIPAEF